MTGLTTIDGIDIYVEFGAFVSSYADMIAFPSLKEPDFNDWHEDDGIDVDMLEPALDSKEFDLQFGISEFNNIDALLELLSDGAYHTFVFNEIEITKSLRLTSHPKNKVLISLGEFTLKFADDFPLEGFVPDTSSPTLSVAGFEIDNKDFLSYYNVQVLDGIKEELSKAPDVKENLYVNVKRVSGATYDDGIASFKEKKLEMKCLYHTDIENAGRYWWQNYYNLLYDMVQPQQRILYVDYQQNEHSFYYDSSKVSKLKIIGNRIWIEFSLFLILTNYRVGVDKVLSTEDGKIIILEDRICAIDLN